MEQSKPRIHETARVAPDARIGCGTVIWDLCQVREGAVIGEHCILGRDTYIDAGVVIGNNVKIQNGVSIYHGVRLEDGVFCGPHCTFTNDKYPRAINPDGSLKGSADWTVSETIIRRGASIGAHATVVCGIVVGEWAMIGAGAVVTKDVPPHALMLGNPARQAGYVCACGQRIADDTGRTLVCSACARSSS